MKNQKGFTVVEGLLIFAIVAVIGFAGWFVYSSQKKTNDTLNKTAQGQGEAQKAIPKTTITPLKDQTKYLEIKEWGVEIPLSADVEDAYYTYKTIKSDSYDSVAYLGTKSLTAMDAQCAPDNIGVSSVFRQSVVTHDDNEKKADPTFYEVGDVHVGNYYYGYGQAQAGCSDSASKQQATDAALFKVAYKNIKAIQ